MQCVQCAEIPRIIIDRLIERGHIDPVNRQQTCKEAAPSTHTPRSFPCDKGIADLRHDLLALSNHEEIEEICNRLDVVDAGSSPDDERHIVPALPCMERDPRQIKHIEDIRIDHLVLEREP